VELDLVCKPEVSGVGAQVVQVDEQAGPLALEEVGVVVGVGGMKTRHEVGRQGAHQHPQKPAP
jgi:hypothetical protein